MKYIQKRKEPQDFSKWKDTQKSINVNYHYRYLLNPEKRSVHSFLLIEQGYICCYCCKRVEQSKSHIEHLAPQSKTDAELSLDYINMLGSCGRDPDWPEYCGNKKQNLAIAVSPLQSNCEDFFTYSSNGEIVPTTKNLAGKKDAETTIEVLALNHYDLTHGRIQALKALEGIMTQEEAELLAQFCKKMNPQGQYQPFCNAILYYLKDYFGVD